MKSVLGQIGERVEDGPLGHALRDFAVIVQAYLDDSEEMNVYASVLADKGMEVGHLVMDLLEELGLVNPE